MTRSTPPIKTNSAPLPRIDGTNNKLNLGDRHAQIKQIVQSKGFVTIEHLAREFGVTPQTIRAATSTP